MKPLPVISLWEPWAVLWAGGKKRIETRSWPAPARVRGPVWVHAAKRFDEDERLLCTSEPFRSALAELGYEKVGELPLGCIVGQVVIDHVFRFDSTEDLPPKPEACFGDYTLGRWGWRTSSASLLAEPIPLRGQQGIWTWAPPSEPDFVDRVGPEGRCFGALAGFDKRPSRAGDVPAAVDQQPEPVSQGRLF